MKENMYRDIYCGEVNSSYIGKNIRLAGWVNSIRNLGNLVFITLRDETGIVQLISEDVEKYKNLHREATHWFAIKTENKYPKTLTALLL